MKKLKSVLFVVLVSIIFTSCTSSLGDIGKTMALVNSLEKMGISPDAAIGGIGGILSLAQGKLDPADLSKVMSAFPDSKNIMKEAIYSRSNKVCRIKRRIRCRRYHRRLAEIS